MARRYDRPEVLASEPEPVRREAAVLDALREEPVPAPWLVATDPDGEQCGVPALLMTRLPGRARWRARTLDGFVVRLAEQLPAIHATPVPADDDFPTYHRYHAGREPEPPTWTRAPDAWMTAITRHASNPPTFEPVFVHRDYHSGNVLWRDGAVTGIVDWAWACRGPPLVDVAHCRLNLVLARGVEAADQFRAAWQSVAGVTDYDPTWDLIDAVDALPDLEDSATALRRLDEWVARTVAGSRQLPISCREQQVLGTLNGNYQQPACQELWRVASR